MFAHSKKKSLLQTKQNKLTLTLAQLFQVNRIAIFLHHKYLLSILVDYSNY